MAEENSLCSRHEAFRFFDVSQFERLAARGFVKDIYQFQHCLVS